MIADWALARSVIGESKVVEDAGPAVDVPAQRQLRRVRREEADRAGCRLAAALLQHNLGVDFKIHLCFQVAAGKIKRLID